MTKDGTIFCTPTPIQVKRLNFERCKILFIVSYLSLDSLVNLLTIYCFIFTNLLVILHSYLFSFVVYLIVYDCTMVLLTMYFDII